VSPDPVPADSVAVQVVDDPKATGLGEHVTVTGGVVAATTGADASKTTASEASSIRSNNVEKAHILETWS